MRCFCKLTKQQLFLLSFHRDCESKHIWTLLTAHIHLWRKKLKKKACKLWRYAYPKLWPARVNTRENFHPPYLGLGWKGKQSAPIELVWRSLRSLTWIWGVYLWVEPPAGLRQLLIDFHWLLHKPRQWYLPYPVRLIFAQHLPLLPVQQQLCKFEQLWI